MRKVALFLIFLLMMALTVPAIAQDDEPDDDSAAMQSFREFIGASGQSAQGGGGDGGGQEQDPPPPPPTPSQQGNLPNTLTNHDGNYQAAVQELQQAGVIPDGGSLAFEESRIFANARGTGYLPAGTNAGFQNVVIAGEINLTSTSTELESCGLLARVGSDEFLVVGLTNQGFGFALESSLPDSEGIATFADGLNPDGSHHVLFIARDDSLTVYVDGELAVADFPIVERSGSYGMRITSDSETVTDCVSTNVWAYRIASDSDVCEIIATSSVNVRSGPGTSNAVAGQLSPGEVYTATGQGQDNAGFTWYELERGGFVREDVITAQGACSGLPQAN